MQTYNLVEKNGKQWLARRKVAIPLIKEQTK